MAGELKILETNIKCKEIINFYPCIFADFNVSVVKTAMFVLIFFISRKRYSIREVLKHIAFQNTGIAKVLALERDVKPRNSNFAKAEKRGGGQLIGRGRLYG